MHHKFLPLLFSLALLSGCYYSEHNPDNIQPPQIIVDKEQNLNAAPPVTPPAKKPSTKPAEKTDGPPLKDIDVTNIPDAIPKKEPLSVYGNPSAYTVFGKEYHILKSSKIMTRQASPLGMAANFTVWKLQRVRSMICGV